MALYYVFGGNFLLPRKRDEVYIGCPIRGTIKSHPIIILS